MLRWAVCSEPPAKVAKMACRPSDFADGAFDHVSGSIARCERLLADDGEAARLVEILGAVKVRHGLTFAA